jgi:hypothetical protein
MLKIGQVLWVMIGFGIYVLMFINFSIPSMPSNDNRIMKVSTVALSQNCFSASFVVNGTNFSSVWPGHTDEVWNLQANNMTDEAIWHPSNFSEMCDAGTILNTSIHAPPLYNERPSGLRLVMLGDSVSRFQSIMLMHFLHTGHWIHDSMQPSFLRKENFGASELSWLTLYRAMETYFGNDHMVCDCIRGPTRSTRSEHMIENIFYRDKECLDNSVSYFSKFGFYGFRGYQNSSDVNRWFQNSTTTNNASKLFNLKSFDEEGHFYTWIYHTYEPFLRNVVAMLEPRPRVVVINEGLWTDANLSDETVVRRIRDTIRDLGMVSVYRTTTKLRGDSVSGISGHDKLCCEIFDHCLRMDWTACCEFHDYYDSAHFLAHANLRFVEQLLNLLAEELGIW